MKFLLSVFLIALTSVFANAQPKPRHILSGPDVKTPAEAIESGLGGKVRVEVEVDETGKVTQVRSVIGPVLICSGSPQPDIEALQKAAKTMAAEIKFEPSEKSTTEWVQVNYPSARKAEDPTKSETRLSGATVDRKRPADGGIVNGRAIVLPKPPYPAAARAQRASGVVEISVLISSDGIVYSAEPKSGHPALQAAATRAACGARFSKTKIDGNPVEVTGIITYNFVP